MVTENEIGVATNIGRFKYAELDGALTKLKVDPTTDKFVILFDISYHLQFLEFISKDEKLTDKSLSEELLMRLVYGLLNNVAHYRHYVSSRLKCGNVIVIYSSDPKMYVKYPEVLKRIEKLLNLFKKTIFIEKLDDNIEFIYQHMAYFTAMNLMALNNTVKKKTRIIYIGQNQLAPQLLRIDRQLVSIFHKNLNIGPDKFFDDMKIENTPPGYRDVNLITSMLALCGIRGVYHKLESLRGVKSKMLYHIIHGNCSNFTDKDNPTNITNGLYLAPNDENFFKTRLQAIDIDFHDKIYALSKTMFNVWSSKIQTNQVYNLNEKFSVKDITLNVGWLND